MTIDLAPCPVCGKAAENEDSFGGRFVRCPSSMYGKDAHTIRIYGRTKRETINAWNRAFKEKRR